VPCASHEAATNVAPISGIEKDPGLRAVLRALAGQWVDPDELGYDLAFHHIAVVAESAPLLEAAARHTETQLLRVQAPDGGTWAWLGGRTRITENHFDALITAQDSFDTRVAFGEPTEGIAGFAASHQQALEARAIAIATNQSAIRFADVRVLIAVLRDPDLAKELVEHELHELARPTERMCELRQTLRLYLEHSQSVSATAAVRRRNRKTIERQLRSIEQLIHHHVSDRSVEVLIALRVADVLRQRDQLSDLVWRQSDVDRVAPQVQP
jgi:sugar diacid utilization regulator